MGGRNERSRHGLRLRRLQLWEKDPRCFHCGRGLTFDESVIDHLVPWSQGGTDAWDNLVLSCKPCNATKGTKPLGFDVPSVLRTLEELNLPPATEDDDLG